MVVRAVEPMVEVEGSISRHVANSLHGLVVDHFVAAAISLKILLSEAWWNHLRLADLLEWAVLSRSHVPRRSHVTWLVREDYCLIRNNDWNRLVASSILDNDHCPVDDDHFSFLLIAGSSPVAIISSAGVTSGEVRAVIVFVAITLVIIFMIVSSFTFIIVHVSFLVAIALGLMFAAALGKLLELWLHVETMHCKHEWNQYADQYRSFHCFLYGFLCIDLYFSTGFI